MITLTFPDGQSLSFASLVTIQKLAEKIAPDQKIVGGILNGKVHDLDYQLHQSGSFKWIYQDSAIGNLLLERTLSFVFLTAAAECFPGTQAKIQHTIASGLYITLSAPFSLNEKNTEKIRLKMQQMIDQKVPIQRRVVSKQEAIEHFEKLGMHDKAMLLKQRTSGRSSIYSCLGHDDYFYGVMAIHAGMIDSFTLLPYRNGLWLSRKKELIDQPKLFEVFQRFEKRGEENGVSTVWQLNEKIKSGKLAELIETNERRVQNDLEQLAKKILARPALKVVLIAGPSSAGKTTFSRRLAKELAKAGKKPIALSMDDFFKDRDESPRLPDGSYDYENVECLELELFNKTILALLQENAVALPVYDFKEGCKRWPNPPVSLQKDDLLIIEGIHALNPKSSALIDEKNKIRIYINALTHLNYDSHNRIPTSDYRLIRRMSRDVLFRGRSLSETIRDWPKVRDGEDRYIYPYQEEADELFNTSMDYELPVLKTVLLPQLNAILVDDPQYIEANRIKKLLDYFVDADPELVPSYSILKEFLGGSEFTG